MSSFAKATYISFSAKDINAFAIFQDRNVNVTAVNNSSFEHWAPTFKTYLLDEVVHDISQVSHSSYVAKQNKNKHTKNLLSFVLTYHPDLPK